MAGGDGRDLAGAFLLVCEGDGLLGSCLCFSDDG